MHGGSDGEGADAVVFGDRGSPCMDEQHSKVFQESRSTAGDEAPGGEPSFFCCKHGVDQWYS